MDQEMPDPPQRLHPDVRSRWVMLNGTRTHYWETGENGPAIVMCHSGTPGSSGLSWFGPIMPLLGRTHRVLALDSIGGFGWTDPAAPAPLGALSRLEHLSDFVDTLCVDSFVLVGASQGAWIAARYAIDHPGRVSALVLSASRALCSAMGLAVEEPAPVFDGSEAAMKRTLLKAIHRESDVTEDLVRHCLDVAQRPRVAEARAIHAKGQQSLVRDPAHKSRHDLRNDLPRLDLSSLILWGTEDKSADPHLAEALRKLLPQTQFRFIPGAAHQLFRDQPSVVAKAIEEWLLTSTTSEADTTLRS